MATVIEHNQGPTATKRPNKSTFYTPIKHVFNIPSFCRTMRTPDDDAIQFT